MMKGRAGPPSPPPHSFINPTSKYVRTAYYTGSGGGGMAQSAFKGAVSQVFLTFLFFCPRPELENKNYKIKLRTIPVKKIKNAPPGNPVFSIPKQSS